MYFNDKDSTKIKEEIKTAKKMYIKHGISLEIVALKKINIKNPFYLDFSKAVLKKPKMELMVTTPGLSQMRPVGLSSTNDHRFKDSKTQTFCNLVGFATFITCVWPPCIFNGEQNMKGTSIPDFL
eukprot:UN30296